jgi:CHAT domain-containing protein
MKKLFISCCFIFCVQILCAQQNIFNIYEQQYQQLLNTRGVSESEIKDLMKAYSANRVSSDDELAKLLKQLYSKERGIAVLFYYFNNDTLRRSFLKPGQLIESVSIPIKKEKLLQLGENINASLDLYELSNNRTPQHRGNISLSKPASKQSFKKATAEAAKILLPAKFDSSIKHLMIIPALNIGTTAFHLLPLNKGLLIDQCSFTIIPSLIDLVALRGKLLKKSVPGWAGLSLPNDFDAAEEMKAIDKKNFVIDHALLVSNPAYPTDSAFKFPDLPGAEAEVRAAIPFSKNYTLLQGNAAKKDSVKKYFFRSNLAWFATHGIADQADPMGKSFLVLSEPSSYFTAKEIMTMRTGMKAMPEMVILSACQTGLGKSMEAGTAGLARSFLIGGSYHVIMSLWNVDDKATAYFMERFIIHLQQPHRFMPSEPLRLAALDTRKKFPKPSQWASFSLFGIDY